MYPPCRTQTSAEFFPEIAGRHGGCTVSIVASRLNVEHSRPSVPAAQCKFSKSRQSRTDGAPNSGLPFNVGVHPGTDTVVQTGPDASRRVGMSRIGNQLAIRPPAEYHSAKPRFGIGASRRYEPAANRIGGSAKMRPQTCFHAGKAFAFGLKVRNEDLSCRGRSPWPPPA